jgi:hypothetical protein
VTRRRRPSPKADPSFVAALAQIAARIAAALADVDPARLPVHMFIAGGAAMHLYTGVRATEDVDAVFSSRILLPEDLDVYYLDARGEPRLLYFDRQYNDTLGLLHEDAMRDLAVSKIGRFEEHDRGDIAALSQDGLITARALRRRAEEALSYYVGHAGRVRTSIDLAVAIVEALRRFDKALHAKADEGIEFDHRHVVAQLARQRTHERNVILNQAALDSSTSC